MSETLVPLEFVHRRLLMDVAFAEVRKGARFAAVAGGMEETAWIVVLMAYLSSRVPCYPSSGVAQPTCASTPTVIIARVLLDTGPGNGKHWIALGRLLWPCGVPQVSSFARRGCSEEKPPRANASHDGRAYGTDWGTPVASGEH